MALTSLNLRQVTFSSGGGGGGGDDDPATWGTIVLDTRAGGNASIQGASTLANARDAIKAVWPSWENADYGLGFTTDLDGAGTRAFRAEIPSWGGVDADWIGGWIRPYVPSPYLGDFFIQWKQWMGRTSTGGGIGTVGAFDITNEDCPNPIAGHKDLLICRYNAADTGGCGARADFVFGGPSPVSPGMEGWYGAWESTGRLLFNVSSWNPEDHYNEVVTFTIYFKAASSDSASDGVYKCWVNGVLRANHTGLYISAQPMQRFDLPSVWRSPHFDMTEYYWDLVVGTP